VRALGALRREEGVPVLRDVAVGAPDTNLRQEAIEALAAIGTPGAREALATLARRHHWPWKRAERRLRQLAASALLASQTVKVPDDESRAAARSSAHLHVFPRHATRR